MITLTSPWHAYAAQSPREHDGPLSPPTRFEWGTHQQTGPGTEAFGRDLCRRTVLELGCGTGHNAAHLADQKGAHVTAVDVIDLQIRRARNYYEHLSRLTLLTCDAMRFLRCGTDVYDAVYSVFGAVGLIDPAVLLPAIHARLNRHRPLVFSVPHPARTARRPVSHLPQTGFLTLPDGTCRALPRWELDVPKWTAVLARAGFRLCRSWELHNPAKPGIPTTLLISARRL
ncbi:class I SAM-dependent methyltransferase [Streptomyces sp. NPDC047917]|uniref:class I SAM-dependent methyltransferase n=1 Tax=Streptomyces sp. NPDC047917 TaxID=3365491 RepID=UPI00371ED042